ncbi:sialic acid synthase [Vibrio sp. MACH09]|uniref:acetyltransferase n=1 Tax=Vibrio sp. MACH09 TaxID=3025122 RepID=UPI00278D99C9|nr:acetyltransferase [Vibrio sp. MACH09]GLO59638.1 sialic acid synthase [Vibrio sp. MACH09]
MSNLKPIIIIGSGGHASVLVDILRMQNREIIAVVSAETTILRAVFDNIKQLVSDDDVFQYPPKDILLVNGIGFLPRSNVRSNLTKFYTEKGYQFATVVAEDAAVSSYATIMQGAQVLSGARVQAGAVVGEHTIINTAAVVEHDCNIGVNNHIAPCAILCGQVKTEADVFIGANATIIQNVELKQDCIVGAGATLTRSLLAGQTCYPSRSQIK